MSGFSVVKLAVVSCMVALLTISGAASAKPNHHKPHHRPGHSHHKPHKPGYRPNRPSYKPHRPHHRPGKPRPVIVVPVRPPKHHRYHRRNLPKAATFAVIAGITYAIIDNMYYRQQGQDYIYDPNHRH